MLVPWLRAFQVKSDTGFQDACGHDTEFLLCVVCMYIYAHKYFERYIHPWRVELEIVLKSCFGGFLMTICFNF